MAKSNSDPSIPPPPPAGGRNRRSGVQVAPNNPRRRSRPRGYSFPNDQKYERRSGMEILLCVFNSTSQGWRTKCVNVSRRITDRDLWAEIRRVYRDELELPWRRIFLFKKLKLILPIEYTQNDVPVRTDPKNFPDVHDFMHCFHHPRSLGSGHRWIEWFEDFAKDPSKSYGLEFRETLWAEKLAALALAFTIAIVVVSIVWCVKGGNLQTVFTVMGFVLSFAAAEIALVALYYQVSLPG